MVCPTKMDHLSSSELQAELVKHILKLPDELLEQIIRTTRSELIDQLIMQLGDASAVVSSRKVALRVQRHLFRTFQDTDGQTNGF